MQSTEGIIVVGSWLVPHAMMLDAHKMVSGRNNIGRYAGRGEGVGGCGHWGSD